ncbi:MAG: hypothetical protein U0R17_07325 [Acidimicrobiia bacterium]
MTINSTRHDLIRKKQGLSCSIEGHIYACLKNQKRNNDDGGLLVEVLVGMFILVLVFAATTIGLSSMADQRVKIEQRDRALALASNYEELSRTFKCGFLVDKVADSLAAGGNGKVQLYNQIQNCDFEAKEKTAQGVPTIGTNGGDQDFDLKESINENDSKQTFSITMRYWWQFAGTGIETDECAAISTSSKQLPLIMVRSINVTWKEKGVERDVSIIKRDPVPSDDVVFASGTRVSLLITSPLAGAQRATKDWEVEYYPYTDPSLAPQYKNLHFRRYIDKNVNRLDGQPFKCAVFSYITQDGIDRKFNIDSDVTPLSTVTFAPNADAQAQDLIKAN